VSKDPGTLTLWGVQRITKFNDSAHATNRRKERGISLEAMKDVVNYHDRRKPQRRGEHGGIVSCFYKIIDNQELAVVAEIKPTGCARPIALARIGYRKQRFWEETLVTEFPRGNLFQKHIRTLPGSCLNLDWRSLCGFMRYRKARMTPMPPKSGSASEFFWA
jgi:hypothetical protein